MPVSQHARSFVIAATAFALLCLAGPVRASEAATKGRWLARHPDTALRVLVWNVDHAFFRENEGFQKVLRSVDADLLILDEMSPGVSPEMIANGLPVEPGRPWHVLYGIGGGPHQRASIAARRPLRRIPELDQLAYPPGRFDDWLSVIPPDRRERARGALEAGVPAVGGLVEIDGRHLLVAGLDLQCCGDGAGSLEEQRRQFESRSIRAAIDGAAASRKVDAVVVGGDFNTVNGAAPITIMQRGAKAKTSLRAVEARHRDGDAAWTWDGRGTPYPSGRLDYLLHSRQLVVLQSQVYDTEDLALGRQQALQVTAGLSRSLSPHRPVVVDFGWR